MYYDLFDARKNKNVSHIAILRIEQLYPFPDIELEAELKKYPHVKTVVWCQEEPKNQGAWYPLQHHIQALMTKDQELIFVGREASAAPAVGSHSIHLKQQKELVEKAIY